MTLFEALKFNREPLEMLISLGGKQDDLRFIDLYTEYEVITKLLFRLFECCALSFFERFVLSFSLKIERFVSDSAEIWICGL